MRISAVITTRNEKDNLPRCLTALKDFDDIIVFDSGSTDKTVEVARQYGARVESFNWNGAYPKKRQYFLNHIKTKYDYIFFVDADEQVTDALAAEMKALDLTSAGYFVKGLYNWQGQYLRYGLKNNKLVLFHRHKIEYPIVKDLGAFCMGEMEGHYQPVLKLEYSGEKIGTLDASLIHFAYENQDKWFKRHERYARWEAGMIQAKAYPDENKASRQLLKHIFRRMPCRGEAAFVHSYIAKRGFLDGRAGFAFANSRRKYYKMVSNALNANKSLETKS